MRRAALFLFCIVALDFATSSILWGLFQRTNSGERGGLSNFALSKAADVLVLGSSRAQFQIMPAVIGQRLSLRAFNAGLKGHDFLYSAALYDLWLHRHPPPRAVVLTVDVESLIHRQNEAAAAQVLAPYIDESDVLREVLYSDGPQARLEYLSRSYRYNGKVLVIAKNIFLRTDPAFDGFTAQHGNLLSDDRSVIKNALDQDEPAIVYAQEPFWDMKLKMLRDIGARALQQHTLVLLVHAPLYGQDLRAHKIWIERMNALVAATPGIEFVDLCEAALPGSYPNPRELFWDVNHLNARGALIFSGLVADELQKRMIQPDVPARIGATTSVLPGK
jgi:hypothetical protein